MCNFLYSCKKEPCYQNFHKNPTWLPVKLCNRHVIKNLVIKFSKEITFFLWIFTPNKLQMFFVHLWHAKVMSIIFNINSYQNKIFMLEDVIKWNLPLPNSNLLSLFLVIRWFLGWYKLRIPLKTFGRFFLYNTEKNIRDSSRTQPNICYEAFSENSVLLGKCPYSKFFWSVFFRIRTEYGPENLRIRTLFTQYS